MRLYGSVDGSLIIQSEDDYACVEKLVIKVEGHFNNHWHWMARGISDFHRVRRVIDEFCQQSSVVSASANRDQTGNKHSADSDIRLMPSTVD